MPKDNENMPVLSDGPTLDAPARSFAPDQMVRCEACLRANPPTRLNCLYCGSVLPVEPSTVASQKPTLRPLEKWEHGYNNILLPSAANLSETCLSETAAFLRLDTEDLRRILASQVPLPLARSSSKQEATLIQQHLENAKLDSLIIADTSLGLEPPVKLRALKFHDDGVDVYQSTQSPPARIVWTDFVLMVSGRITRKRVELQEERKRSESQVLEADQFFADETVIDLYEKHAANSYRIVSSSFDFSCLAGKKQLVAAENITVLDNVFRERAAGVAHDQTYNAVRKALEPVWRSEQQNESTGWRRERPGKYSLGTAMETSNESQFSRYSRLRYYLLMLNQTDGSNG